MPEAQNISHQESFLFQFANIHCVKKVLSCYRPEKKLNRTPTVEPEVKAIPYENCSVTVGNTIYDIVDGKAVCIGNTFFNPELFKAFCRQHGVEGVSCNGGLVLWEHCQQALKAIADNNERATWERCVRELNSECTHRELFQHEIYRQLLQVFEITKDLRFFEITKKSQVQIKQCPCCGRFWIKSGKAIVFCSKECDVFFHQPTREKNAKSSKKSKESVKKIQAKKDCKRISEIYQHNGYGEPDAEKKAAQWVQVQGKSFKQFRRKEGSYSGEGLDLSGF